MLPSRPGSIAGRWRRFQPPCQKSDPACIQGSGENSYLVPPMFMIKTILSLQMGCPIYKFMNKLVYDKNQMSQRTGYGRQQAEGQGPASRQPQFFAGLSPPAVANQVAGAYQILSLKHVHKPLAAPG